MHQKFQGCFWVMCCDMSSVLQDAPGGTPLQKSLSSYTPLESALHHPWRKLSARFTHKLVYALRGEFTSTLMRLQWCSSTLNLLRRGTEYPGLAWETSGKLSLAICKFASAGIQQQLHVIPMQL